MTTVRIALANIPFPETPAESVALAEQAIAEASAKHADVICFPECFVPGYRGMGKQVLPPDAVRDWLAFGMKLIVPNAFGKPD